MKFFKASLLFLSLALFSCDNTPQPQKTKKATEAKATHTDRTGNYVSNEYANRDGGSDWIAVKVNQLSQQEIEVKVRSRADIKKPTCTFDAKAKKLNDSTYQAVANGNVVLFVFQQNTVSISAKKKEDNAILNFYCSGGGSLEGSYSKINEELDANVDPTIYSKVLMLEGIGFDISTVPDDDKVKLTIAPFGLSVDNTPFVKSIEGKVNDSEIGDLNSDGFPELMIYTQAGPTKTGNVEAVSVNNGKSMSLAYFRPTAEDSRISTGYNGHDEFKLVDNQLRQRFPIYENGKATGRTRQAMYSLEDGEAMRIFNLQNVSEY